MKAVRCQNGRVLVQEVARPEGPGMRVRIASAGICGSDLHLVAGAFPMAHTLGHEFAGTLADGTAVALEDRCCHRALPLSMGRVIGDRLQCGYHGLEFDTTGACVAVPGQYHEIDTMEDYGLAIPVGREPT